MDGLALFPFGVLVVWDWEWVTTDNSSEEEIESDGRSQCNQHMNTDESETDKSIENEQHTTVSVPAETHVVTFKCMGTLFEQTRQSALEKTADLMCKGDSVPVKLVPEPENKGLSALAPQYGLQPFQSRPHCFHENDWSGSKLIDLIHVREVDSSDLKSIETECHGRDFRSTLSHTQGAELRNARQPKTCRSRNGGRRWLESRGDEGPGGYLGSC